MDEQLAAEPEILVAKVTVDASAIVPALAHAPREAIEACLRSNPLAWASLPASLRADLRETMEPEHRAYQAMLATLRELRLPHLTERVRDYRTIVELVKNRTQPDANDPRPLAVLGDFNATWEGQRSPVRDLAERLDLVTTQPHRRVPSTYPTLRRRLDWILVSRDVELVGYHVLVDDRLSDHRAVIADVRVRAT